MRTKWLSDIRDPEHDGFGAFAGRAGIQRISSEAGFRIGFSIQMSEPPAMPTDPADPDSKLDSKLDSMPDSAPASIPQNPEPFLDVQRLLRASQPQPRGSLFVPGIITLILLAFGSAYLSSKSEQWRVAVDVISGLLMLVIMGAMGFVMWTAVRRQREERARIEAIEELVQLRRWQQAGAMLSEALSQPAVSLNGRVQFLIFLCSVLARYNRFEDAVTVQNHLMETVELDPSTLHALRLGRAMAMLREDSLVDADRAISDLRRDVSRAASAAAQDADPPAEAPVSAGLALIELYRDVKTGHAAEAIEMFNRTLPAMRKQLGHRVADAHALAAKAYDFLSDSLNAQANWERATLLSPEAELLRRYPELISVSPKYRAAVAPATEIAGAA
ncbi:hypothetical protein BH09PLA1_BH09PLA1_14800 [soil metagenome]